MEGWIILDWILKCFICLLGVFFFGYSSGLLSFNFKKFLHRFRRRSPEEAAIQQKAEELDELQRELATLSPVNEFAAYFKRKRVVDRVRDELNALSSKYQRNVMVSSMKETAVLRLACALLALVCACYSYDLVIFYVNRAHLWPFNFWLAFPYTWISSESREGESPVTLFSFLCMLLVVKNIYNRRRINAAKKLA